MEPANPSHPYLHLSLWTFNRGIQHAVEMMQAKAKVQKSLAAVGEGPAVDQPTLELCIAWANECKMDPKTWKELTRTDEPVPIGKPKLTLVKEPNP